MEFRSLLLSMVIAIVCSPLAGARRSYTPINKHLHFGCTPELVRSGSNTHYYCDKDGTIKCSPGWQNPSRFCNVPICEVNNQTCVNGKCSRPYVCDCDIGWTGPFCEKCVRLPGCVNGNCSKPYECSCYPGWEGMNCDKPVCEGCVHGHCAMPNMCVCHPGWSGENCIECETKDDCVYGRCVDRPLQCKCYSGYTGTHCDEVVCKVPCNETGGYCANPETCVCRDGWQGKECNECVPYWGCSSIGGSCKLPWQCNCKDGYYGYNCTDTEIIDGNWGSWGEWSDCSQSCGGGTRTRVRFCNNPAPSGGGRYCSLNGSDCTEEESCNPTTCDLK